MPKLYKDCRHSEIVTVLAGEGPQHLPHSIRPVLLLPLQPQSQLGVAVHSALRQQKAQEDDGGRRRWLGSGRKGTRQWPGSRWWLRYAWTRWRYEGRRIFGVFLFLIRKQIIEEQVVFVIEIFLIGDPLIFDWIFIPK